MQVSLSRILSVGTSRSKLIIFVDEKVVWSSSHCVPCVQLEWWGCRILAPSSRQTRLRTGGLSELPVANGVHVVALADELRTLTLMALADALS